MGTSRPSRVMWAYWPARISADRIRRRGLSKRITNRSKTRAPELRDQAAQSGGVSDAVLGFLRLHDFVGVFEFFPGRPGSRRGRWRRSARRAPVHERAVNTSAKLRPLL